MEAVWDQQANRARGGPPYARHRPEETLLYQVIDDYYPDFIAQLQAEGRTLPRFVWREFEDYLKCGRLEHGFLRVRCTACHAEKLVAFSGRRRGFCASCGARRMVESAALRCGHADSAFWQVKNPIVLANNTRSWDIPAERPKTSVGLAVPLTPPAVKQFRRLKRLAGRSPWVGWRPQTLAAAEALQA